MLDLATLSPAGIAVRLRNAAPPPGTPAQTEFPSLPDFLKGEPRPAAVLIPLIQHAGEWRLLLTRRNADLPEHSGQVAFPGGRTDPDDTSPEHTALREAEEEIGVRPQDVQILGRLQEFLTITNYRVTPVVGLIPWPYPLTPSAREVSRIFTIPLAWLLDPQNSEERLRELPAPHAPVAVVYFKPYDGEILWGASARFTMTLLELLRQPLPTPSA
jgi:8-oxo-dGTP pyrophosphatase MutT (NUDIX family)